MTDQEHLKLWVRASVLQTATAFCLARLSINDDVPLAHLHEALVREYLSSIESVVPGEDLKAAFEAEASKTLDELFLLAETMRRKTRSD